MSGTWFVERGYAAVGLWNPKNRVNVGSALRAAGCFDARLVAVQGQRYRRSVSDTSAAYRHLPLLSVEDLKAAVPFDCVPVAIEVVEWARPLHNYTHPARAFYVFGPEDGSLPGHVIAWCRDVVSIPSNGCLNLAGAVNVVLYDRSAKRTRGAA